MKDEREVEVESVETAEIQTGTEDGDQEPTGYDVEEEDGVVVESRFSLRDKESIDWLEPLASEAPTLLSLLDFNIALSTQAVSLTQEAFERRFIWCLKRLGAGGVSGDLLCKLYGQATFDLQQMSAFNAYQKTLRSERFNKTHEFIRDEVKRLEEFARLFSQPRKTVAPEKLAEWRAIWLGSLLELTRTIAAQLLSGEKYMVEQKSWLRCGRTQMESHLLSVAYKRIKTLRTATGVSISSMELLVAYAHASSLVPFPTSASSADPVAAMKARISRTRTSQKRTEMLGLMLVQGLTRDHSKH